jgi:hypothetical protein
MDSASKTFDERLHALFEKMRNAVEHSQPTRKKVAIISTPAADRILLRIAAREDSATPQVMNPVT